MKVAETMDFTQIFRNPDELAEFCCLPNIAAQDARLAERLAELAEQGVYIAGMQCGIKDKQQ